MTTRTPAPAGLLRAERVLDGNAAYRPKRPVIAEWPSGGMLRRAAWRGLYSSVGMYLRVEPIPSAEARVVVHMGVGNPQLETILATTIRNHDLYFGLNPDQPRGVYALSVYVVLTEDAELAVLEAMPQNRVGKATIAEVTAHHDLWPTSDDAAVGPPAAIQHLHWDVVLRVPDMPEIPPGVRSTAIPTDLRTELMDKLRPALAELLALFNPRVDKRGPHPSTDRLAWDPGVPTDSTEQYSAEERS